MHCATAGLPLGGLLARLYKTKSYQSVIHPPVDPLPILCMPVNHTLRSRLVLSRPKNIG